MGMTIENFSLEGNIPEARDRLHVRAKGEHIVFALAFKLLKPSGNFTYDQV
jgi:hypothetical protein